MSARLVLHMVTTLVLFAVGWWLYMRMGDSASGATDSITVATYWFASLVFVLFSWIFYWFVHRLKLKAWLISLVLAIIIAAVSTVALTSFAADNQRKLEEAVKQKPSEQESGVVTSEDVQEKDAEQEIETLNLSEEEDSDADQSVE